MNTLVLVPKNSQAVKSKPDSNSIHLYVIQDTDNKTLSTLYQNRLSKFHQRKHNCETYEGIISNIVTKQISTLIPIVDESKIRFSDSWKSKKRNTIYSYFQDFGQMAFAFSFKIELDNIETVSTMLLCAGKVVTLKFEGNKDDEYSTTYILHSHGDAETCDVSCNQSELKDLDVQFLPKFIPTYNSSVSQKQSAFIQNFVKNKNFQLNSQDYYCGISYNLDGTANINGILWTLECSQFNKHLSLHSLTGQNFDSDNFLAYIQRNILTACNTVDIQTILNITTEEAVKIKDLVMKFQLKMNMKEELPLPSFECFLTVVPPYQARENIAKSEEFLDLCRSHLVNLKHEEKENMSTYEWLNVLSRTSKFTLLHNDRMIEIEMTESKLIFIIEERMSKLIQDYGSFIGKNIFIDKKSFHFKAFLKHQQVTVTLESSSSREGDFISY